MNYLVYFLFGVWYLGALGGLLAGGLMMFGPPVARSLAPRPRWFHFASPFYTIAVASILLWLYLSGYIGEWTVIIAGNLAFLPELIFRFAPSAFRRLTAAR